jgi:peptide/nickel transport system substrate-binding protein
MACQFNWDNCTQKYYKCILITRGREMNDKDDIKLLDHEIKYQDLDNSDKGIVEKMVESGHSRRDVLKLATTLGVTLVAAENILFSGNTAIAATPKKGGSVRIATNLHGPNDQLDPPLLASAIDYTRGRAIYNGLIQHSNNLSPQPELAESFESNSNATEWTFKIRKGVEFHDGSKLTADDVIYSMRRHQGEDSVSGIKSLLSSVKEWKKTGTHEVKAIMSNPNADLPITLGVFQAKIAKNGSTGGKGNGTGPFTLEAFEPGVRSIHKRNENYWRDGANLDSIEVTAITDPVARVNALLAGDVQMISQVDPKAFRQVESAMGYTLLSTPAAVQMGICCLKNTAPGSNDDFVKGMQFAQDRNHIVNRIMKGKASIGNDINVSAAHGMDFCSELPQREFDLDKAKFHFKKSGINSAELFVTPLNSGLEEMSLLAQANCGKIGFDLKLKKVPTDGYWGSVWMKEPLNVVTWNMRPTANTQMTLQFGPESSWNDTYWKNPRMGALLKASLAETNPDKRHDMYCEMQTLIHNNSGMVIPAFTNINDAIADNIKGMPTVPLGPLGGCEWPEFVWLA